MKTRRETLEEFVFADPNDSFPRYALALELEKEGREQEAVSQLKEVTTRDPGCVAAYYQLGRLLAKTGFVEQAREVYRRGLDAARAANDQRTLREMSEALEMLE